MLKHLQEALPNSLKSKLSEKILPEILPSLTKRKDKLLLVTSIKAQTKELNS